MSPTQDSSRYYPSPMSDFCHTDPLEEPPMPAAGTRTMERSELNDQLADWLSQVQPTDESMPIKGCRAIIAPHAAYAYSGPAAAWAYKSIDTTGIKRVFILGPSHHLYLDGCALSACKEYETPLGPLKLDIDTVNELKETGQFETLSIKSDEDEHSVEMHLSYVRKIFEGQDISIVPIVVGAINYSSEAQYGALLAPYLAREDTFCIVSSDFCHWGARFSYTYYYPSPGNDIEAISLRRDSKTSQNHPIYKSISKLDHEAMSLLTLPRANANTAHRCFADYLTKTRNTICGRHPIGVLLGAMTHLESQNSQSSTIKWVRYEQSSECHTVRDSSVSYASAWVKF